MKINEIAGRLDITPRAIRLYESKGLVRPAREDGNGYRDFTERDAWRLQTIASLRGVGLGLSAIKSLLERLDEGDSRAVHHYLELQRMALTAKWVEDRQAIGMLDEWIARLERKGRLEVEDLFQLTARLKEASLQRESWLDAWQFDDLAARYDGESAALAAGPDLSQSEYGSALDLMQQWLEPQAGEQGLDIGAGTGNLAGPLAAAGARMSAVDQSKEMLALCRAKHPGVQAKLGNALALPFADGQFAFAASAFALHFLNGPQQLLALAEIDRVLAANGRICIVGLMTNDVDERDERDVAVQGGEGTKTITKLAGKATESTAPKHAIRRVQSQAWLREHGYVTVHYAINSRVGALYAIRKH